MVSDVQRFIPNMDEYTVPALEWVIFIDSMQKVGMTWDELENKLKPWKSIVKTKVSMINKITYMKCELNRKIKKNGNHIEFTITLSHWKKFRVPKLIKRGVNEKNVMCMKWKYWEKCRENSRTQNSCRIAILNTTTLRQLILGYKIETWVMIMKMIN